MSRATLERARAGDPKAFDELTAPYVRELQLRCYRMLGSLSDAEDTLQHLPPRQAATLLLRDVLGYTGAEVAAMLETSQTAIKAPGNEPAHPWTNTSPMWTAGKHRFPARRRNASLPDASNALIADDIDGVIALLTDDAWLAMPPAPHEYRGRAAIAGFLRQALPRRRRVTPVRTT